MVQVLCTRVQQLFIEHLFVKQSQEYSVKKKKRQTRTLLGGQGRR